MILLRRVAIAFFVVILAAAPAVCFLLHWSALISVLLYLLLTAGFVYLNFRPATEISPLRRLRVMMGGRELIVIYALAFLPVLLVLLIVWLGYAHSVLRLSACVLTTVSAVLALLALGVNGVLRIYLTSVQLGLKLRVAFVLLWWLPPLNWLLLIRMCRVVRHEYHFETAKAELDAARAASNLCATKYPLLLVHGVFFRDQRFFNYWGRIPAELVRNGARVWYGEQQSAASVAESGEELRVRIKQVLAESGSDKLNIIAHSKGGLDARYAISCLGLAGQVASLTTINTPHRGCAFAEYLLNRLPQPLINGIARNYDKALRQLGDDKPDFLRAVRDLTVSNCATLNKSATDQPGVYYQSVMTRMKNRRSAPYPLRLTYLLVRRFDRDNDGLVAVESARWGERFSLIEPSGRQGISHGDVIDLYRKNLIGFDVREFYVDLVHNLKLRGC